jgi:hypothetical protein
MAFRDLNRNIGKDRLASASETGAANLFQDARVTGFARAVVAVNDRQTRAGEAKLLVVRKSVDVLDVANLPEADDGVPRQGRLHVRSVEWLA